MERKEGDKIGEAKTDVVPALASIRAKAAVAARRRASEGPDQDGRRSGGSVRHMPVDQAVAILSPVVKAAYIAGYETAVFRYMVQKMSPTGPTPTAESVAHADGMVLQMALESLEALIGRTPSSEEVDLLYG